MGIAGPQVPIQGVVWRGGGTVGIFTEKPPCPGLCAPESCKENQAWGQGPVVAAEPDSALHNEDQRGQAGAKVTQRSRTQRAGRTDGG